MLLLVGACDRNKVADESQVAVHVNRGEISVHQIQSILHKRPKLEARSGKGVAAQILEVLVDQELAAQAAMADGLESDPTVIQALQLARRETLANAYHDRVAAKAVLPSSDEIDRYYDSHPALFAQRKLYTLQEFAVEGDANQVSRLVDLVKVSKTADAVVQALRDFGLRYTTREFAQAAEDVPLGLLDLISKMSAGESVVQPQTGGARVFSILHVRSAPVDRRIAQDPIAKYLMTEQKRKLVGQAMMNLRKDAQVRYVGSFSNATPATLPAATKAPEGAASTPR